MLYVTIFIGYPIPIINWFRDGVEIPSNTNYLSGKTIQQSEITLGPLGRSDLNSRLICRAMNHPKSSIVEAVVQIDMNCE